MLGNGSKKNQTGRTHKTETNLCLIHYARLDRFHRNKIKLQFLRNLGCNRNLSRTPRFPQKNKKGRT